MLARSLGVQEVIVVINKMDDITVNWSEKRFNQIKDALSNFLKSQCGYNLEKSVKWVPISGLSGENIVVPVDTAKCPWYKGPVFMDILDNMNLPKKDDKAPVRLPVMDKYKEGGFFIFGKVESGTIIVNQTLAIVPSAEEVQIAAIFNSEDKKIPYAKPGENVKVNINFLGELRDEIDFCRFN